MSSPRMVEAVHRAETGLVDMGVYLGGADGCMAEHFLDGAHVGAMLQHVRGEAVAQHVRRDARGIDARAEECRFQ